MHIPTLITLICFFVATAHSQQPGDDPNQSMNPQQPMNQNMGGPPLDGPPPGMRKNKNKPVRMGAPPTVEEAEESSGPPPGSYPNNGQQGMQSNQQGMPGNPQQGMQGNQQGMPGNPQQGMPGNQQGMPGAPQGTANAGAKGDVQPGFNAIPENIPPPGNPVAAPSEPKEDPPVPHEAKTIMTVVTTSPVTVPLKPKDYGFSYTFATELHTKLEKEDRASALKDFCEKAEVKGCDFSMAYVRGASTTKEYKALLGGSNTRENLGFVIFAINKKLTLKEAITFLEGYAEQPQSRVVAPEMNLSRTKSTLKRDSQMTLACEWRGALPHANFRIFLLTDPSEEFSYLVAFTGDPKQKLETDAVYTHLYQHLDRAKAQQ